MMISNSIARQLSVLVALPVLVVCSLSIFDRPVRADAFQVSGVKLHYIIEGKGEPVVLLHGLNANARVNWQLPGIFSELSKSYRVIAIDLPGHGESDRPEADSAYGAQMVEDVAALLDHLKIKRAHIIGYSMGGMITMKFLAKHQDRVLSAVVGGMGWLRDGSPLQSFWDRLPERQRRGAPPACMRSFGKLALTPTELAAIKVPVEVVVGDRDPVKRLYVETLQRARKDWPVVEVKDAGHLNCVAKPQFKEALVDWLSKH